tara:strand:- start:3580 stop:5784 length:2205 start_codon:yes stop_codon:yes gene_type:complete
MDSYSNFDKKNQYGQSVTNYTSRDFSSIKQSLIQHVKSYFPQVYRDFNETSPGMMLIELSAYVGDVLNYYIDDSFKEMLLPLSEDRRNVINLSKITGYKPKPVVPSFVDLKFSLVVDADTSDINNVIPNASQRLTIQAGTSVTSTQDPEITFETLEPIDFSIDSSGLGDTNFVVNEVDASTGLVSSFKADRSVKAVSGKTKTITFNVGQPEQFKKLTLNDTDIIEILSCVDSNGNNWYEVDFLAQENVPITTFYTDDANRSTSAEQTPDGTTIVPSSLSYIRTTKRFIKETNEDNTTSLVFGNGLIKNGNSFETTFLELEQEGVSLPTTVYSPKPFNPQIGGYYESLGESPQNTTLTITYRAGGGLKTNLPANDLTTISTITTIPVGESTTNLSVNNDSPAVGGKEGDFSEEIRQGSLANYSTQNRCVTKEDFEARTISMPSRFGSIAKVYCSTGGTITKNTNIDNFNYLKNIFSTLMNNILDGNDSVSSDDLNAVNLNDSTLINLISNGSNSISTDDKERIERIITDATQALDEQDFNATIDLYVLSYNVNNNLISSPTILKSNLKNFLGQFRLLTDKIRILDGFIINFGVVFDVMAFPGFDKTEIKNRCIQAIKQFYDNKNMKFKQTLYSADVINILNSLEGVKAVNDVIFTQQNNFTDNTAVFTTPLYSKSISQDGSSISVNSNKYGHYYNFETFFDVLNSPAGRGVILPSFDPSVFEIKNPDKDIKGVVK